MLFTTSAACFALRPWEKKEASVCVCGAVYLLSVCVHLHVSACFGVTVRPSGFINWKFRNEIRCSSSSQNIFLFASIPSCLSISCGWTQLTLKHDFIIIQIRWISASSYGANYRKSNSRQRSGIHRGKRSQFCYVIHSFPNSNRQY